MKKFTNELGNEITITISEETIDRVEGVLIQIEGPTSISENHITRLEAEMLKSELDAFMTGKGRSVSNVDL